MATNDTTRHRGHQENPPEAPLSPSHPQANDQVTAPVVAPAPGSGAEGLLDADHTEVLLQFQDLTRIDDLERCRAILETHNWDIGLAIRGFSFGDSEGTEGPREVPPSLGEAQATPGPRRVTVSGSSSIETENNNQPISLLSLTGLIRFISLPFHFFYDSLLSIFRFAWSLVRPDPRAFDPVADVINFIGTFEANYGVSHPTFYRGNYSQAVNDAKKELKFLLVYLHGDHHQDTNLFCRQVLTHSEVISYINRNNLLFWACSVNSAEGYRTSQALRENTYPFLALIGLKENRMTVVRKFEGKTTVESLLSRLQQGIEDNEASLVTARLERQERSMNQIIRQQQDEAYEESLKADQEKERKRKEEKAKKDEEEKVQKDKEQGELQKREDLLRMKVDLADRIPVEPEADAPGAIRLLIKLPNGKRLERRFLKTMSIKYLFYFIFCHDQSPVHFQVVTNFPRKVLPCRPPTLENPDCDLIDPETGDRSKPDTFERIGLGSEGAEMLFVSDLEA